MSRDRAIVIVEELKKLIAESSYLDSSPLTREEYPYKTPFGADTMEPSKWLYRIYLDRALESLKNNDLILFKDIKDFSFYFTHYYETIKEPDAKKLCKLIVEFEQVLLQIQGLK